MKIEVRSKNEAVISGYVNAVARDSRLLPKSMCAKAPKPFYEQIMPGTFASAIKKAENVELRFNHRMTLGGIKDGTLTLKEDNIGLWAEAVVRDENIIAKAENRELQGWSFGFIELRDTWEDVNNETCRRKLSEIELQEVSILDKTPAYIGTSIASVECRGEDSKVVELRFIDDEVEVENLPPEKVSTCERYRREIEIMSL